MEKSRSLFQQINDHKMLFVFFLLFNTDSLVEGQHSNTSSVPENLTISPKTSDRLDTNSSLGPTQGASFPEASRTSLASPLPEHQTASLEKTSPISEQETTHPSIATDAAAREAIAPETSTDAAGATSTQNKTITPILSNVTIFAQGKSPHSEAQVVNESSATFDQKSVSAEATVPPDPDGKQAFSPTKDFGASFQESFSEPTPLDATVKSVVETTKSTGPRQDKEGTITQGPDVPEFHQTHEAGNHSTFHPFSSSVTLVNQVPESHPPDKSVSEKNYTLIIIVVIFLVLLLVVLLVFLYRRHRRQSGSTSLNASEWAGQAALPDDTGLDKEIGQEAGAVGDGEARRGTLVTFFGKRETRVPSVAMEDISGKAGKEETERLFGGETDVDATAEGFGDANGKVPEPLLRGPQPH